jgi:hypothetical protein
MARPEKRWQLLLVAEDGRIVPFKRIKGVAVTLAILLVILGLACAGLGWQLTAERIRHRRTLTQLADANRQVLHYKSEHELVSAELVLAEARMEKAGMLIPRRQTRIGQQQPEKTVDTQPELGATTGGATKATASIAAAVPTAIEHPSAPSASTPPSRVVKENVSTGVPAEAPAKPKQPPVAMDDLDIKHDARKKILVARFRVNNTGPRSSPVAGRCVVVLKNDQMDPGAWLTMPGVKLVNGKPGGERGQAFKISRYKDMEIKAMGPTDPSSYKTATVYVFDSSGDMILEKDFSIDLPAPKPQPVPVSTSAAQPDNTSVTPLAPDVPKVSPPITVPIDQPAPAENSGRAVENQPIAPTLESDDGAEPLTGMPADDSPLTKNAEPEKKEDTHSRF